MMRSAFARWRGLGLAVVLVSSIPACGGASSSRPATAQTPPPPPVVETQSAAAPTPPGSVRRTAVTSVLSGGLGLFLQKVTLDDQPVMKDGRFHGFRIASLSDAPFWSGVDIRPGDVVTSVNGMPIEHPEEALEAFRSLGIASEVRVAYERAGQPRELRYTIIEDEPPKRAARAN